MATDDAVAPGKSASHQLLALLLSPGGPRAPLPDLDEILEILELCGDSATQDERTPDC